MEIEILKECPLFAGIEPGELAALLDCLSARRQHYARDAFIFRAGDAALYVGVVLSGGVNVIQEDFWGARTILTHIAPGGLFGEAFSCTETRQLPVSVVATEASQIMLIDYRKIITACSSACVFHAMLIANMLRILADKNILLTRKIEYLSRKTIRERLLAFLSAQAVQAGSRDITIPYNRQELADFLSVERSALSRELALMKKDGLLDYRKNRFTLLAQP